MAATRGFLPQRPWLGAWIQGGGALASTFFFLRTHCGEMWFTLGHKL